MILISLLIALEVKPQFKLQKKEIRQPLLPQKFINYKMAELKLKPLQKL